MKMNTKMFKNLKNPVDVQEVDGHVVEVHYMNDTEYLAKYAGQGYFFVWASDGNSYKLLVEKGYYENLDELFLPEVNKMQIKLYEDLAKVRKNVFLGLFIPIVLLVIAAIAVTYFVEQFNDYQVHVLIGGLVLLLVVNIFQSSFMKRRIEKLRNEYFYNLEQYLGEEKLQELVVRQREYHAEYFDFDDEELEAEELEELEEGEAFVDESQEKVVPAWVSENHVDEMVDEEETVEEEFVEEELVEEEMVEEPAEEIVEESLKSDKLNLDILSREELKEFVKDRKISGYSTMKKDELISALPQTYEKLRVVELQALAKANNIANFSTMRKDELVEALVKGPKVQKEVVEKKQEKQAVVKAEESVHEDIERVPVVESDGTVDLSILTVKDLKDFGRDRKVPGFSTMRKDELVKALPNVLEELRLVELKAVARESEIPNFSTMRKNELLEAIKLGVPEEVEEEPEVEVEVEEISVLNEDGTVDFNVLTLEDLKVFAKERKVSGFSTMRKGELVAALPAQIEDLKNNELRALARAKKVANFSTMRKQELIEAIQ